MNVRFPPFAQPLQPVQIQSGLTSVNVILGILITELLVKVENINNYIGFIFILFALNSYNSLIKLAVINDFSFLGYV